MDSTWRPQQAGPVLAQVLAYCVEHPYASEDLDVGELTFQEHTQGNVRTVSILGDVPDAIAVTVELLERCDQTLMSFDNRLLVFNVYPTVLLYEPVYVGRSAEYVVFTRVCPRCRNSRKVPDWSQGLDPVYGEPKAKPCPECRREGLD